jgi:glycosyltransferase involved in cell wall biosynthesis
MRRLQDMAGPSVEFLGSVPEDALPDLMAGCRAFLFPGAEDFGITPVEAMAAGRPVIAYASGGALDTVVEGVSGTLFQEQTVEGLCEALARFEPKAYDPQVIRQHAVQFDRMVFEQKMSAYVARAFEERGAWS